MDMARLEKLLTKQFESRKRPRLSSDERRKLSRMIDKLLSRFSKTLDEWSKRNEHRIRCISRGTWHYIRRVDRDFIQRRLRLKSYPLLEVGVICFMDDEELKAVGYILRNEKFVVYVMDVNEVINVSEEVKVPTASELENMVKS